MTTSITSVQFGDHPDDPAANGDAIARRFADAPAALVDSGLAGTRLGPNTHGRHW